MKYIEEQSQQLIQTVYQKGIKPLLNQEENFFSIPDPFFQIKRNRVTAEIMQAMIQAKIGSQEEIIGLSQFLLNSQQKNGSWHEIHPNYNEPSALVTSFVGDALLSLYQKKKSTELFNAINKAKEYVLSQEQKPGYFLKSTKYTADHLNVDSSCAAFLANYSKTFDDSASLSIAEETAKHIINHQWKNGVYPYTIDKGNYKNVKNLPCMHYQAVTLYYLIKIQKVIQDEWLQQSILKGAQWLKLNQKKTGSFHWEKSGLLFAYYLTGSYAFATNAFHYLSKYDKQFQENAYLSIKKLKEQQKNGLFLRWQQDKFITLPLDLLFSFETALIGKDTITNFFFRYAYASYRQIARRRIKKDIDKELFNTITKLFNIKTSTIEPFNNYSDIFMSSEIINSLSSIKPCD